MIKSVIRIALSYFLIFGQTIAYAQSTAALLPQGKQQFFDNNGDPLTSGKVFFYIPFTTTTKTTWQDSSKLVANANPVILDGGGRAIIYGDGTYRQIVKDRNNNTIYDAVTASAGTGGTTGTGDGDLVGTVKPWAGLVAPNQYAFAYGQEISRNTYSVLFTAITLSQPVGCTLGSPILTGLSDTSQIPITAIIEATCVAAGSRVISKTSTTITLDHNASLSTSDTIRIFLYGNGNGSTTFNLPDLRGYTIIGRTNMGGTTTSVLNAGAFLNNPAATGAVGGTNGGQTLNTSNLPPYTPAGTISSITPTGTISSITPVGTISQITPAGSVTNAASGTSTYTPAGTPTAAGTITKPSITSSIAFSSSGTNSYTPTGTNASSALSITNGTSIVQATGSTLNLTASGALGQAVSLSGTAAGQAFTGNAVTGTISSALDSTPLFSNSGSTFAGNSTTFSFTGTPVTPTFTGTLTTPTFTGTLTTPTFTGTAQGGTAGGFSIVQPSITLNYIIKITPDSNSSDASGVTSLGGMTGDIACGDGLLCTSNIISNTIANVTQPYTGAISRPIQSKLNDFINVADFGAVGDGTDEKAKIQAALNAMGAQSNGGQVILDCKTYSIGSSLIIPRGVELVGQCYGGIVFLESDDVPSTRIKWIGTNHGPIIFLLNRYYGRIENIEFDGGFNAQVGIYATAPQRSTFKNISINLLVSGTDLGVEATGIYLTTDGATYPDGTTQYPSTGNIFDNLSVSFNGTGVHGMTWKGTYNAGCTGNITSNTIKDSNIISGTNGIALNILECADTNVSTNTLYETTGASGIGIYMNNSAIVNGFGNQFYGGAIVVADGLGKCITAKNNDGPHRFYGVYPFNSNNSADRACINNLGGANILLDDNIIIPTGKYATINNSLTLAGTDTTTITFQGTGTYVSRDSTDTLTNKTINGPDNTLTNIANASLANSSTTVNGQTCTLGASCTITAAASAITVGTTTIGSGTDTRILFNNSGVLGEYTISGSGNVAMTTNPIFTTPALGTPSALVLTNATGTPTSIGLANGTGLPLSTGISGFGTGVATALGVNTGSAGAVVLFNGSLGTPSGGTLTNATGLPTTGLTGTLQAAQEPAHTGDVTNSAGSVALTIANNAVTFAKMATQTTNTIVGNATSGTAVPTALSISSCSTASSALIWTTNTGFGCNTSIIASAVAVGGITGLGTGVATALAVNIGSVGAFVTFNGAGGTPSSMTATNLSGTAASLTAGTVTTNANLTGDVTSVGNATTLAAGSASNLNSGTLAAARLGGMSSITNSLGADVNLNNTANFFDGPSIAQGTTGTWFASGNVTVTDTVGAAILCKLWDGTTTISSGRNDVGNAGNATIALSGYLASPAANIRISCRDATNTTGQILSSPAGITTKGATVSAFRIN